MARLSFFLIGLLTVVSSAVGAQDIPVGTVAILVRNVSFERAVSVLASRGYHIDSLDRKKARAKTAYKPFPNSIVHLSISVHLDGDAVVISGDWWTEAAPNGKGQDNIMRAGIDGSQPMKELFGEIDSYAKSLKGPISYIKGSLRYG